MRELIYLLQIVIIVIFDSENVDGHHSISTGRKGRGWMGWMVALRMLFAWDS